MHTRGDEMGWVLDERQDMPGWDRWTVCLSLWHRDIRGTVLLLWTCPSDYYIILQRPQWCFLLIKLYTGPGPSISESYCLLVTNIWHGRGKGFCCQFFYLGFGQLGSFNVELTPFYRHLIFPKSSSRGKIYAFALGCAMSIFGGIKFVFELCKKQQTGTTPLTLTREPIMGD